MYKKITKCKDWKPNSMQLLFLLHKFIQFPMKWNFIDSSLKNGNDTKKKKSSNMNKNKLAHNSLKTHLITFNSVWQTQVVYWDFKQKTKPPLMFNSNKDHEHWYALSKHWCNLEFLVLDKILVRSQQKIATMILTPQHKNGSNKLPQK